MEVIKDRNELHEVTAGLLFGKAAIVVDVFEQIAVLNALHHKIIVLSVFGAGKKFGNKRVAHFLEKGDFALEAGARDWRIDRCFLDNLDSDWPLGDNMSTLPNRSKSALADTSVKDEGANCRSGNNVVHCGSQIL
jgi:hypothetical protein